MCGVRNFGGGCRCWHIGSLHGQAARIEGNVNCRGC